MTMFNPSQNAPGVYAIEIEEISPIAGVTTSVTAIVGPAQMGPKNTPVQFTNWTDFTKKFGSYFPAGTVYAPLAVKGFFDNGGTLLYFVRASNAKTATVTINDHANQPTISVTSLAEGTNANGITMDVSNSSVVSGVALATASASLVAPGATNVNNIGTAYIASNNASSFLAGDVVTLGAGTNAINATINSIRVSNGPNATVQFTSALGTWFNAGDTMHLADIAANQQTTTARISDLAGIEPGTILTISSGSAAAQTAVVKSIDPANKRITLDGPLSQPVPLSGAAPTVTTNEFSLTASFAGGTEAANVNLSMDPRHSRYFANPGVFQSKLVAVERVYPPPPTMPPDVLPAPFSGTATSSYTLVGGTNETLSDVSQPTWYQAFTDAIDSLKSADDVNILCVPDRCDQSIQLYMINHCELLNRFAILDPGRNFSTDDIQTQRGLLGSSSHAALYYPRIVITDPTSGTKITVPPSGHIAGVYAKVDAQVGVHKAPANVAIAELLDLETQITQDEQVPLNNAGINVIRWFKNLDGALIYGARTLSTDLQWRYISTRRLTTYIEQSLIQGTQPVLFQPNNQALWGKLSQIVAEFLTRVWYSGALMGLKATDGFAVQCDAELNPPASVESGVLTFKVTIYPAPPAEYIVFLIYQEPGGPITVQES